MCISLCVHMRRNVCRCRNAHVYAHMHICIDEAGDFQEAAFPQDLSPLTLGLWLGQLSEDPSACPRAVAPDLCCLHKLPASGTPGENSQERKGWLWEIQWGQSRSVSLGVGVRAGGLTLNSETAAMASGCRDWGNLPALS